MSQQISRILAPTDFSPASDRAVRRAASLASTLHAALHLIHVLPPHELLDELFPEGAAGESAAGPEGESTAGRHGESAAGPAAEPGLRARAERLLKDRAEQVARRFNVTPECTLFHGEAHQGILEAGNSLNASLIVFGAQGEREGSLPSQTVGDTAFKVVQRSRIPVLLVRREPHGTYSRVMACVKAAPADRALIEWAKRLSPADLIHVVSAYTVPYERRLIEWGASPKTLDAYARREQEARTRRLSDLLREFSLAAARARLHVERGDAVPTILGHADQWQADLLLVGQREQANPFAAGAIGSVARHIASLASVDVMIIPAAGAS